MDLIAILHLSGLRRRGQGCPSFEHVKTSALVNPGRRSSMRLDPEQWSDSRQSSGVPHQIAQFLTLSVQGLQATQWEALMADFVPSSAREYVTIKLDSKERKAVEFAARQAGKSVSAFVLDAARDEAMRVIRRS